MPRRILEGNVVSNKCDKTVTVLVERRYMHPVYKKYIKSTGKYTAHDENNQFKVGDRVSIIECRPLSKRKRWTVIVLDEAAKTPSVEAPSKKSGSGKKEDKKPAAKKEDAKKAAAKKSASDKTAPKKGSAKKSAAKKPVAKKTTAKKKDA